MPLSSSQPNSPAAGLAAKQRALVGLLPHREGRVQCSNVGVAQPRADPALPLVLLQLVRNAGRGLRTATQHRHSLNLTSALASAVAGPVYMCTMHGVQLHACMHAGF